MSDPTATATTPTTPKAQPPQSGDDAVSLNNFAPQLISIVERIERLEEEKTSIADDIKEVYAEAKATGFDTATMRKVIKLRKMDPDKRREQEMLLETYMAALSAE